MRTIAVAISIAIAAPVALADKKDDVETFYFFAPNKKVGDKLNIDETMDLYSRKAKCKLSIVNAEHMRAYYRPKENQRFSDMRKSVPDDAEPPVKKMYDDMVKSTYGCWYRTLSGDSFVILANGEQAGASVPMGEAKQTKAGILVTKEARDPDLEMSLQ